MRRLTGPGPARLRTGRDWQRGLRDKVYTGRQSAEPRLAAGRPGVTPGVYQQSRDWQRAVPAGSEGPGSHRESISRAGIGSGQCQPGLRARGHSGVYQQSRDWQRAVPAGSEGPGSHRESISRAGIGSGQCQPGLRARGHSGVYQQSRDWQRAVPAGSEGPGSLGSLSAEPRLAAGSASRV
ncbi:hypothetical protein NDU88_007220 [Pleurodeles waltl]|uniref:Uncharacterized protein n=1 Tax=Pleurodeles waltl TaxID=8319 RepID=A0AAV7LRW9_PLEWA|nr:hypothetical protein NDU88_007220 [Pleurodeles waltl]